MVSDKESYLALAVLALSYKLGQAYKLDDGIDLVNSAEIVAEFVNSMEPDKEYGSQVVVPDRYVRDMELSYVAPQRDESIRGVEVNAIAIKRVKNES